MTTIGLGGILVGTQASQAHVGSVLHKLAFSQESQCPRCKQPLRLCMRNKILRSANAKYHYSYLFFYKINKGDLPLMYSCVFWCEFIDLVGFSWLLSIMKKVTGVKQ